MAFIAYSLKRLKSQPYAPHIRSLDAGGENRISSTLDARKRKHFLGKIESRINPLLRNYEKIVGGGLLRDPRPLDMNFGTQAGLETLRSIA